MRRCFKILSGALAIAMAATASAAPPGATAAIDRRVAAGWDAAKMTPAQKQLLMNLLDEYANNIPEQGAAARREQIRKAGTNLQFAWTGGSERGEGHYYRVQGPTFLVEYDNTQNNNNHVHSVWRDYNGDFGFDLLGNHYQTSH